MTNQEILNLKFYSEDLQKEVTIKDFFKELLTQIFIERDQFSEKAPFNNSGWEWDIFACLIDNALVKGEVKRDENGKPCEIEIYRDDANELINNLIKSL